MLVSLIKKNAIYNTELPSKVFGNYWVTDVDLQGNVRELVSIEENQDVWVARSNADSVLIDASNNQIESLVLKEYSFGYIKVIDTNELSLLYTCPLYDRSFKNYSIEEDIDIFIGSGTLTQIKYQLSAVGAQHAKLFKTENSWYIEDLGSKFGVYVNNQRIMKAKLLPSDVIFIMGLKIIFMNSFIVINNPFNQVLLDEKVFKLFEPKNTVIEASKDDTEVELYSDDDYFFRSPRFQSAIEREKVVIDSPPGQEQDQNVPFLFTVGPMLTMALTSMISAFSAISGIADGSKTLVSALPTLIIAFAMMMATIGWPLLSKKFQKRQKRKREKERQEKYGKYIDSKRRDIEQISKKQKQILNENFIPINECENIILNRSRKMWERKIEHQDFLAIRLGMGAMPLQVDIDYPRDHFTMDEDNLRDTVNSLVNEFRDLNNVPVNMSLAEKYIVAIVGKDDEVRRFFRSILFQLITFHSYQDLKLVFLIDEKNVHEWDYVKTLPHVWTNDKSMRFFATNYDEMNAISIYLDRELNIRLGENKDYKAFSPYYIIITDNYKMSQSISIVQKALQLKSNVGFNVIVLNRNLSTLPNECTTFINIKNKVGGLFESELISTKQKEFSLDDYILPNFYPCCRKLANVPIKFNKDNYVLPNVVTFLEMYNVGKIEQLNAMSRWKNNNPTTTLQAPVGFDSHGMFFKLDIHEKAHGPHGLIAGMTGSGKSEFIITYILSLAVNYHPHEVSFILIDYKGGGLAGAFSNEETGVKLPHIAGTITNLDTVEMNRSLVSIQSELRRRQIVFNEARDVSNESTIDIYKYQTLYRDGIVKEPISHLLIICDEFAELKVQQPEFMDQLISTARIGRSLGVHLILATQKPSGVVNDQIWSNSRFRVCLKVQEKSDSMDMIKRPDAASLKQTGRFYLQVGYDEYFALGQAAWCGAQYAPSEKIKKKVDTSIEIVNNIGEVIKEVNDQVRLETIGASVGDQLTNIVKYLSDIAKKEDIYTPQLWLDMIPAVILISDLQKKYGYVPKQGIINPVIGEYDDPANQRQDLLTLPLSRDGNTIIYGATGSGREMTFQSLLYSIIINHSAEEVNFYIIEFGSEASRSYASAPQVGDILFIDDVEKIDNLFKFLKKEIELRKKLFVDYSGDFNIYLKSNPLSIPTIVVIINNYEAFVETYQDYDETIIQLTREGFKYGIIFVLTVSSANGVRYKVEQNFKQKLVLQMNDNSDYSSILGNVRKMYPSRLEGRGLVNLGGIYEFQTASITNGENITECIKATCEELKSSSKVFARKVPTLPSIVSLEFVKTYLTNLKSVPIGVEKQSLSVHCYDFVKNFVNIISGSDINLFSRFLPPLLREINAVKGSNGRVIVVDSDEVFNSNRFADLPYFTDANEVFENLMKSVDEQYNVYQQNNYNSKSLNNYPHINCCIIGIDKFKTKLNENNKNNFDILFEKGKDLSTFSFILVDSIDKFKKMEYDRWYRSVVIGNQGIWIGNGVADQYVIKLTKTTRELYKEIDNNFGYVINRGIPILVKLLEDYDTGVHNE